MNEPATVSHAQAAGMVQLSRLAWELRLEALRMIHRAGSGHPGGSLSAAEILTALYFRVARVDPGRPSWAGRDRIFVSKGHCAPLYYAALARRGFFPTEELTGFRRLGSRLQGHPDRNKLPGVEMSSGPLGLGASVAVGCALGLRQQGVKARTFCLLGDGEIQEGIVWEAALAASKYALNALSFIVDCNRYQLSGAVAEVLPLEPLAGKWRSFGWEVRLADGHDVEQVVEALESPPAGRPLAVIARTVKGKGVSFMEDSSAWHGRAPTEEEMAVAEREILERLAALEGRR